MSSQAVLLSDPLNFAFALTNRVGLLAAIEAGVWPADTRVHSYSQRDALLRLSVEVEKRAKKNRCNKPYPANGRCAGNGEPEGSLAGV